MDSIEQAQNLNRRQFLSRSALGLGTMSLASMAAAESATATPDAGLASFPNHRPKAKRVIYLFQSGAPSQFELLDHKPELQKLQKQELPASIR